MWFLILFRLKFERFDFKLYWRSTILGIFVTTLAADAAVLHVVWTCNANILYTAYIHIESMAAFPELNFRVLVVDGFTWFFHTMKYDIFCTSKLIFRRKDCPSRKFQVNQSVKSNLVIFDISDHIEAILMCDLICIGRMMGSSFTFWKVSSRASRWHI